MKQKLLSIVAGTVIGCAVTTTAYAGPTPACLAARADLGTVMDAILECKNFVPTGSWVCTSPTREVATQEKNDCLAVVRHECRGWPLADGVSCDVEDVIPVEIPPTCQPATGTWLFIFDWFCDSNTGSAPVTLNCDSTIAGIGGASWSQDGSDFEMSFSNGTVYVGTISDGGEGDNMSGTMSEAESEGGSTGCWTAVRIDSDSTAPASVSGNGSLDGN